MKAAIVQVIVLTLQISLALTVSRLAERLILNAAQMVWKRVVLWAWAILAMRSN